MSDSLQPSITTRELNLWYGKFQALINVSVQIKEGLITSLIGPSGCGKTTLLRCFNRVNERYGYVTTKGEIKILGKNIYDSDVSLIDLRKAVGMVFQRPNPLPISIYENVVFGLRIHSERQDLKRAQLDEAVETALTEVGLWNDLKDRLNDKAVGLQLEQQQKLCIARLLPLKPRVILMDEPCSALDVEGTRAIEELMFGLKGRYTILIVTHNMAQARRTSDECIFMLLGETIEHSRTAGHMHAHSTKEAAHPRWKDFIRLAFGQAQVIGATTALVLLLKGGVTAAAIWTSVLTGIISLTSILLFRLVWRDNRRQKRRPTAVKASSTGRPKCNNCRLAVQGNAIAASCLCARNAGPKRGCG